jgi:hypothetical protein
MNKGTIVKSASEVVLNDVNELMDLFGPNIVVDLPDATNWKYPVVATIGCVGDIATATIGDYTSAIGEGYIPSEIVESKAAGPEAVKELAKDLGETMRTFTPPAAKRTPLVPPTDMKRGKFMLVTINVYEVEELSNDAKLRAVESAGACGLSLQTGFRKLYFDVDGNIACLAGDPRLSG